MMYSTVRTVLLELVYSRDVPIRLSIRVDGNYCKAKSFYQTRPNKLEASFEIRNNTRRSKGIEHHSSSELSCMKTDDYGD